MYFWYTRLAMTKSQTRVETVKAFERILGLTSNSAMYVVTKENVAPGSNNALT